jgi:hypothetical protein
MGTGQLDTLKTSIKIITFSNAWSVSRPILTLGLCVHSYVFHWHCQGLFKPYHALYNNLTVSIDTLSVSTSALMVSTRPPTTSTSAISRPLHTLIAFTTHSQHQALPWPLLALSWPLLHSYYLYRQSSTISINVVTVSLQIPEKLAIAWENSQLNRMSGGEGREQPLTHCLAAVPYLSLRSCGWAKSSHKWPIPIWKIMDHKWKQ